MIREIFRILNQFAVEIPTLPVDQCHSHLIQFLKELNSWSSSAEEPLRSSTVEKSETLTQDLDLRCQSGQSDRNSVIFSGGDLSKNYGADQRLQISDLHFVNIPYTSHVCLLEDKVQYRGMYLFTISYGSDAMDQRSGDG